jgi:hypothetical protein
MTKIDLRQELSCSSSNCFDDNFFVNSLSQEYIAHLSYKGLGTEQNPNVIYPFDELISSVKPARIIEIGTFAGGFTLMLRTILDNNDLNETIITTYDVNPPTFMLPLLEDIPTVISNTKNLFSSNYSNFNDERSKAEMVDLINCEGTTLVLCDGGCKKCEFNILSDYLKLNDIIMAHDYAPNQEYFENTMKNKIWNWLEISDSDIIDCCVRNGLESFMAQSFLNVAWVCKRKVRQ